MLHAEGEAVSQVRPGGKSLWANKTREEILADVKAALALGRGPDACYVIGADFAAGGYYLISVDECGELVTELGDRLGSVTVTIPTSTTLRSELSSYRFREGIEGLGKPAPTEREQRRQLLRNTRGPRASRWS